MRTTWSEDLPRVEIVDLTRAQRNLLPGLPIQLERSLLQLVDRLDEDEILSQLDALELALPVLHGLALHQFLNCLWRTSFLRLSRPHAPCTAPRAPPPRPRPDPTRAPRTFLRSWASAMKRARRSFMRPYYSSTWTRDKHQ